MRELSLFTGAGGGVLGTKLLGWETVGYVEWDEYCQRILRQRIEDGIFDRAPIFGDIRAFVDEGFAEAYKGMVDIITAGFPCQPFSVAGEQKGEQDERNMWPATWRCIDEIRPPYVLLENVTGIVNNPYAGTIYRNLAESGYDARWRCLSASEVGAPHKRDRWWLVAYTNGNGLEENAHDRLLRKQGHPKFRVSSSEELQLWDTATPPRTSFCGMGDGVAHRPNRLKAVGNGQVPQVVERVWRLLTHEG